MIMEKSRKVSVIDYGMGNLMSVLRAWQHVGADASIISSPSEISPDAVLVFRARRNCRHLETIETHDLIRL
ncbi:MAG: hypothetical protein ACLUKN_05915 [Bacilli bacterium]